MSWDLVWDITNISHRNGKEGRESNINYICYMPCGTCPFWIQFTKQKDSLVERIQAVCPYTDPFNYSNSILTPKIG